MQGCCHCCAHHLGNHLAHRVKVQAALSHSLRHKVGRCACNPLDDQVFAQVWPSGKADADLPRLHPSPLREGARGRLDEGRRRQGAVRHRLRQEEQFHRSRGQRRCHHRVEEGLWVLQHRQDSVSRYYSTLISLLNNICPSIYLLFENSETSSQFMFQKFY